jgi:hypothetical protein
MILCFNFVPQIAYAFCVRVATPAVGKSIRAGAELDDRSEPISTAPRCCPCRDISAARVANSVERNARWYREHRVKKRSPWWAIPSHIAPLTPVVCNGGNRRYGCLKRVTSACRDCFHEPQGPADGQN